MGISDAGQADVAQPAQLLKIRYRTGVVGESKRVVHAATLDGDQIKTVCGLSLPLGLTEEIDLGGAPCMQCTARAALASVSKVAPPSDH